MSHHSGHSLRSEILLLCILSILIVSTATGALANYILSQRLLDQTSSSQRSIVDMRASMVSTYMNHQINLLIDFSKTHEVTAAMKRLADDFNRNTPITLAQQSQSQFQAFTDRWHFHNLLFINTNGDILFALKQVDQIGINLNSPPSRASALAHIFRDSLQSLTAQQSEFKSSYPSSLPTAFMAVPIIHDNQLWGVVAVQLDNDAFFDVALNLAGLGESGEIVLATSNPDGALITAPLRNDPDAAFKRIIPNNNTMAKPILRAVNGESGEGQFKDWRGIDVIAAWTFIPGLNWGIVAKIDRAEAMEKPLNIRNDMIATILALTLLLMIAATLYIRRITKPINELARMAEAMSNGRLVSYPKTITATNRDITLLSDSFQHMAGEILQYQRSLEEQIETRTADLQRLQTAIEHTDNIVMITNRDAIIEYVNPAFEQISGYSSSYAIGRSSSIIKSGELDSSFYQHMWKVILNGEKFYSAFTNRNAAGQFYQVEQVISPIINDNSEITGFVSVQRDVTEEKKQQEQLEHSQRLESLGVLAGGIAHDFNNLLTVIMGHASLARCHCSKDAPIAINLKQIEEASERATELCKQMLDYSGKGSFMIIPLNLSKMILSITELLHVSISKNVTLHCHLNDQIPHIQADKAQMQQVIMNLVINASEAIGEKNGHITIHTGTIDVDKEYLKSTYINESLAPGRYVFMEISDDGCGMDKQTLKKLYDPFFTTKFTGRGLGMSAILGIIRGHHGAIKVYSELDKGSTFKLILPISEQTESPSETIDDKTIPFKAGHGRILVVDDEASIRKSASMLLKASGYEVCTAVDGHDGVELFAREHQQIDLVLLDMTMPRMDGETAFREMRRIQSNVKVILSSGYNEQDATIHFSGKGLAGFLQKPYRLESLQQKIQQVLS
ncbi:MAG: response regulator [Mariprofundus sp.]|nr:response regulator [Mariprofundus sp.]